MKNAIHAEAAPGVARLFDLRDTVRTPSPSAAQLSLAELTDRRIVTHPDADPVYVEQHRRLAAALHHAQLQKGIHTVMVASAVAAEGKTLTATNLALTLSRFRKRVLLVDGDLRKPSVHQVLQIENGSGLSDILEGRDWSSAVQTLSPALSVVTGGHHDPDPVASLVSDAAARFISQVRDRFDWVVVDTPPIVLFPDAGLFANRVDACVLVVGAASTSASVAAKAVDALGAPRILGVVLNRAWASEIAAGYGYGRYGYPEPRARRSSRT